MSPYLAEFIGTFVLISFGCGVNAGVSLSKSYAQQAGWLAIATGWGLGVILGVYASGNFSGGHINPAVTISLAAVGEFEWRQVPGYILSQVAGAMLGAFTVWIHYLPHWKHTEEQATKLGVFCTGAAVPSRYGALVSEMSGTFILIFALMFIGTNEFTQGLNPIVVGILIVAIGLSLGGTTGYAINPARDFGPRLAHALLPIVGKGSSQWHYAHVPIIGPVIGGAWGAFAYKYIFSGAFLIPFIVCSLIVFTCMFLSFKENQSTPS